VLLNFENIASDPIVGIGYTSSPTTSHTRVYLDLWDDAVTTTATIQLLQTATIGHGG